MGKKGTPTQDANGLWMISQPTSLIAEQFRMVRAMFLKFAREKGNKTILITSALPGEGKTFISSNLAVTIARDVSEHVILVDGDLRNPSLHKIFKIEDNKKGFASFLSGNLQVDEIVCKTSIPNFYLIPSGEYSFKPGDVLSAKRMNQFVEGIKRLHGDCYIIFDSGPAQLLADTLVTAEFVDGIVLVVKIGHTKKGVVKRTVDVLGREKIIGVIPNCCELPYKLKSHYYKYYTMGTEQSNSAPRSEKE